MVLRTFFMRINQVYYKKTILNMEYYKQSFPKLFLFYLFSILYYFTNNKKFSKMKIC